MPRFLLCLSILVLAVAAIAQTNTPDAQDDAKKSVYLIFDASNSMWGELPDKQRKIAVAKKVLADFDATDFAGRDLALRVYGHNRAGDCSDTELLVPFADSKENLDEVRAAVTGVTPRGKTPITRSLKAALEDFGDRKGDILLISDGIETCDIDPCELMEDWQRDGIDIRVHVVGFGLDEVSRDAMTCVAETSDGRYFDAGTADQFADALERASETVASGMPPGAREPEPQAQEQGYALKIVARDAGGQRMRFVEGTARREGAEPIEVSAEHRNPVEPGDYELEVGVLTENGEIFKPVNTTVSVTAPGETVVEVTVNRPPTVSATFTEDGETATGAAVHAHQGSENVFSFRWFDEVFVMPGTYEFRTQPNEDNDLRQTATVEEDGHTQLTFELVGTVHIYAEFLLTGGEVDKRNFELWRDGKRIYALHAQNGGLVRPGVYQLRAKDKLTPVVIDDVEISDEKNRTYRFPVEVGYIVVSYDPDGDYKTTPDRAFVYSSTDQSINSFARLNTPLAVLPGEYLVKGWRHAGDFDDVAVTVGAGETVQAELAPRPK